MRGILPVDFGAGQESEYDSARAGEKRDPGSLGAQCLTAGQRADDELRNHANDNLGEGSGDFEPLPGENRDQRK